MDKKILFVVVLAAAIVSVFVSASQVKAAEAHGDEEVVTVVRDSVTLSLKGHILPHGDYILLYDSTPYKIHNGHVALKVPCSADLAVIASVAPDVKTVPLQKVDELSFGGNCLYHADLNSTEEQPITDVALFNKGDRVVFRSGSTVTVGVNGISEFDGHGHEEETEEVVHED